MYVTYISSPLLNKQNTPHFACRKLHTMCLSHFFRVTRVDRAIHMTLLFTLAVVPFVHVHSLIKLI